SVDELLTYGRQFMSFFGSCPNTFGGLARLTLENLRLGESDFPKIFSICNQLEFLRFQQCDAGNMSLLEVEHEQLRELLIFCSSIKRVALKCVPKLTILKINAFMSPEDPFCLGYVPLLQTVTVINTGLSRHKMLKLSELLGKTAISTLHLNFKCEKVSGGPQCCPSVVCCGEVVVIIFGKHTSALSPSFADLGETRRSKAIATGVPQTKACEFDQHF
uniref:F-box/LRR-repeat protein 15/At3g58940/PEG3-like LRR domain-containing protein n=1 Tax=Aegilops tauschii subsp. strangulata TaxID=200361 RepID=A0A453Q5G7_AEGTS